MGVAQIRQEDKVRRSPHIYIKRLVSQDCAKNHKLTAHVCVSLVSERWVQRCFDVAVSSDVQSPAYNYQRIALTIHGVAASLHNEILQQHHEHIVHQRQLAKSPILWGASRDFVMAHF